MSPSTIQFYGNWPSSTLNSKTLERQTIRIRSRKERSRSPLYLSPILHLYRSTRCKKLCKVTSSRKTMSTGSYRNGRSGRACISWRHFTNTVGVSNEVMRSGWFTMYVALARQVRDSSQVADATSTRFPRRFWLYGKTSRIYTSCSKSDINTWIRGRIRKASTRSWIRSGMSGRSVPLRSRSKSSW